MRRSYQIIKILVLTVLSIIGINSLLTAQESGPTVPFDRSWTPEIVFDDNPDLLDMYWTAWEQAWEHVHTSPGAPASPFMDEAFSNGKIWIWDTEFMVMFCKYAPDQFPGVQSLENFYKIIHDQAVSDQRIQHPDNPPFFAWIEWENFLFTGDTARLEWLINTTEYLQKHYEFVETSVRGQSVPGTNEPMEIEKQADGYRWDQLSSGMDNTPRGRDVSGGRNILWLDLMAQQALAALYISRMADEVGNTAVRDEYIIKYNENKNKLNSLYWDTTDNFYYDISRFDSSLVKVKTPASYWPLVAEVSSQSQAQSMVNHLTNPNTFGGFVPLPSLARNDVDFDPHGEYWRGAMWLPTAYMSIKAVEKYDFITEADTAARGIVDHMLQTYLQYTPNTIWECYSPTEYKPSTKLVNGVEEIVRPDFCGWSALGPISLTIENYLGFHTVDARTNTVEWRKYQNGRHGVKNFKFGNITTDIIGNSDSFAVQSSGSYTLVVNGTNYNIVAGYQSWGPNPPSLETDPLPEPGVNLALNKTVTMNPGSAWGHVESNMVDGDTGTHAQSATQIWDFTIDLGEEFVFDTISFLPHMDSYATQYQVMVSTDNANWTTVATETNGTNAEKEYTFTPETARYVFFDVTAVGHAGSWGHAVREVRVFNNNTPSSSRSLLLLDEGTENLVLADELSGNAIWTSNVGKTRGLQLVGQDRVMLSTETGFIEVALANGNTVVTASNWTGVYDARRLANGNTMLLANVGGIITLIELDDNNVELQQYSTGLSWGSTRQMRLGSDDNFYIGSGGQVHVVSTTGVVQNSFNAASGDGAYKAVKMSNGDIVYSGGYASTLVRMSAAGAILETFTLPAEHESPFPEDPNFASGFQVLENGNIVVAYWHGHSASVAGHGKALVEYDPSGQVVWTWVGDPAVSSIHDIIVLDGLDTQSLHNEENGFMQPVQPEVNLGSGPGFPNLNYSESQSGTVLSLNDPGKAVSAVAMHRGYLFMPLGEDHGGGQGDGAFAFYDISDPANITNHFDSRNFTADYHSAGVNYVGDWAEIHHMPVSEDLFLISERRPDSAGFSIFDVSNLFDGDSGTKPETIGRFSYPGITSPSNYDGFSFAPAWQGRRYVWAPTGSGGLYVVDTTNLSSPSLITSMPKSALSNFTLRAAVPVGNLLILTTTAIGGTFNTLFMDISDPANPQQISTLTGGVQGYQPFIYGSLLSGGASPIELFDFSDPLNITTTILNDNPNFINPEYGFGKDDHLFIGHYPGMTKWDLATGAKVGEVQSGIVDDHAFITPLGNLIALSSDHNNGRRFILGIHDHQKDVTAPAPNFASPLDGSTNCHVKSKVGVCFTDFIDQISVNSSTAYLRVMGSNTAIPGTYSTMFGIVNFVPDNDLSPNTTYEFVLAPNGVTDQSGNAILSEIIVTQFSTGSTLNGYSADVVADSIKEEGQAFNISLAVTNVGGFTLEHSWDFGDGTTLPFGNSVNQSHTYSSAGNYLITVKTRVVGTTSETLSTAIQSVHAPLAAQSPSSSTSIVYDSANAMVWNVNPDNDTVTAISGGGAAYRYIRLVAESEVNDNEWASIAELNVLDAGGSAINRSAWTVSVNSEQDQDPATNVLDGDVNTHWHTAWSGVPAHPHTITIDMMSSQIVTAVKYLPRQNGGVNGRIKDYKLYGSNDNSSWDLLSEGAFPASASEQTIAITASSYSKAYEVAVGDNPQTLALGAGNSLWVVNKDDASISVIDRSTGSVTQTYMMPYASAPHAIVMDIPNARAYVSLEALGQVAQINATNGNVISTVDVGPWPRALSLDPNRNDLWVTRFISPDDAGKVSKIDTTSFTLSSVTDLSIVTTPDSPASGRGLPNYLGGIALSPDGTQAFVPSKKDNIFRGIFRDGQDLTFENTVRSMGSVIDLNTGLESITSRIDFDNDDFARAAIYNAYGSQILVTTNGSTLWGLDPYNFNTVLFTFDTGGQTPDGLVYNADGSRLFIHNFMSRTVTIFDNSHSQVAAISTVSNEQLSAEVLLGKQLFYGNDSRLAHEGYMSCASCHLDGGSDGRVWDLSGFGEGLRNTITLTGAGEGHGPRHWSANFDEVHDFEGQIRTLTAGTGLMADEDFNFETRSQPLGLAKAGVSSDLDALAAYVNSLTDEGKSPHRNSNGSLTAGALSGRSIFQAENCSSCHSGTAFTDSASLARHDVGTLTPLSGNRLGGTLDGLDTPTLRGLWKSAPYLHDGSAATLLDVLTTKNISGLHGNLFDRSAAELDDLVEYLLQIDSLETEAPIAGSNGAPVLGAIADQNSLTHISVSLALSAVDPELDTLYWSATGLPVGLVIDPATGTISGAANATGMYTVNIGVTDTAGNSDSDTFTWTVEQGKYFTASNIGGNVNYRYIRLVAESEINDNPWTSIAELNVLGAGGSAIDRTSWTVTVDNAQSSNPGTNAIDGDVNTMWHTDWVASPNPPHPHTITIDMISQQTISAVKYLPRQSGQNGWIKDYKLYGSDDNSTWHLLAEGAFPSGSTEQTIALSASLGGITRDYWSGLQNGGLVVGLTGNSNYPDNPTGTETVTVFEGPTNLENNYGAHYYGYIIPPTSGQYTFWMAADDKAELWLSFNHEPQNAEKILELTSWTLPRDWDANPGATVTLEAGYLYYISALHVDSSGGDNLSVAWEGPGFTREVIDGSDMAPYTQLGTYSPAFDSNSYSFSIDENSAPTSTVGTVTATDPNVGQSITYSIIAGNSSGAFAINSSSGVITVAAVLDYENTSQYQLTVLAADDGPQNHSTSVDVSISVNNLLEGNEEMVRHEMSKVDGSFPNHADPALIGFNADPDNDGIVNAVEVLMGTDPNDSNILPTIVRTVQDSGNDYVEYEFTTDSAVDDIAVYTIEGSSNLMNWFPITNPPVLISDVGGIRTYRIRDDQSLSGSTKRFVRLSIDSTD